MNALIGWNPRSKDVDSNPTPRALVAESTISYKYHNNSKEDIQLKDKTSSSS